MCTVWQDDAEEHLPRIASTEVLYSMCLEIPAPVVLLTQDLSCETFKERRALSPWDCKARSCFPSETWNKKTTFNLLQHTSKCVEKHEEAEKRDRVFCEDHCPGEGLQSDYCAVWNAYWAPCACGCKSVPHVLLHAISNGVCQWNVFPQERGERWEPVLTKADRAFWRASSSTTPKLRQALVSQSCCGCSSPCRMVVADTRETRWNAPRVT